jgi:hypothetical protein
MRDRRSSASRTWGAGAFRLARYAFARVFATVLIAALAAAIAGCNTRMSEPGSSASSGGTGAAVTPTHGYVRIERGVHPLARPEFDLGPLDPDRRLTNLSLVFQLSAEQRRDREALLAAQLDRTSRSYRKWLTPEAYAARFGVKGADMDRTRQWLTQQGFEVRSNSRLGARVNFAARVADLQTAFRTEIHGYKVAGEIHYAMSDAPSIPSELSDIVLALHNTHDFYAQPARTPIQAVAQAICPSGDTHCGTTVHMRGIGLDPHDWATIYDVSPLYAAGLAGVPLDGSGVTISVVGLAPIAQSDINAFRARYGLPPSTVTMTLVPETGAPIQGVNGAGLEAILDNEWSGAIAPGASIDYVFAGGDDPSVTDAAIYAIEQNIGSILSESFSQCEGDSTLSDADVLDIFGAAANLEGTTYVASTGDAAATACLQGRVDIPGLYVNEPASFPGVTAVGGTEFLNGTLAYDCNGAAKGYASPERAWNETSLTTTKSPLGGGGGISMVFARPLYQGAIPTCNPIGSLPIGSLPIGVTPSSMRQIPDVALSAAAVNSPYFVECTPVLTSSGDVADCLATGGRPGVIALGGTSASAPSFAGILALANQATGGRLGNVNPLLYALATTTPSAFHDITTGSNLIACTPGDDAGCATDCPDPSVGASCYGYQAVAGYDCASGLGSIDATKLVSALASLVPTSTTLAGPATASEGTSVTLTATVGVTGSSASTTPLGGAVTFTVSYVPTLLFPLSDFAMSVPVTGATTTTGAATLTANLPVGLVHSAAQYVEVTAQYGGDGARLPSTSAPVRVSFTGVDLCIPQAVQTVAPDGAIAYSASGGAPPIVWSIVYDSTCDEEGDCSSIDPTSGAFTAGPEPGYVIVEATDSGVARALGFVTVGSPGSAPIWGTQMPTSCPPGDAGAAGDAGDAMDANGAEDAGAAADATATSDGGGGNESIAFDAGPPCDASHALMGSPMDATADSPSDLANMPGSPSEDADGTGGSSGCSCTLAGGEDTSSERNFAAVALGIALIAGRRTSRRSKVRSRSRDVRGLSSET